MDILSDLYKKLHRTAKLKLKGKEELFHCGIHEIDSQRRIVTCIKFSILKHLKKQDKETQEEAMKDESIYTFFPVNDIESVF